VVGRVGELDAAGLHAPTGEDLRLDDDRPADLLGDRARLLGGLGEPEPRHGDPGAFDDLPRLVLEEPHQRTPAGASPYASASSGSLRASISARWTITWHCFHVASSCILPSIMCTPRPSGIASMTFLANATSSGSGLNTRFAMSICTG